MTKGISCRQYARQRGCDERLVRRKIADGSLVAAVQPDGKLDGAVADRLWKTTAGPRVQGTLAAARRRRLRATCNVLAFGVTKLRESMIEAAAIAEANAAAEKAIDELFGKLPGKLAPLVAGMPAPVVFAVIDDHVRAALTVCATSTITGNGADVVRPAIEVDDLDETGLAALRHNLAAERTELIHRRQRRELLVHHAVEASLANASVKFRNRMLYLCGKCAPHFRSRTVAESERLLRREVDDALRDLKRRLKESVNADTYA